VKKLQKLKSNLDNFFT